MPARILSPHSVLARPLLEPRVEALYDSDVWSYTTSRIDYFQVPLGEQGVSGNPAIPGIPFTKQLRHTNNERGGSLPHPKMFVVKGIRLLVNDAPQSTSKEARAIATTPNASAGSPQTLLLSYIQYACYYRFRVGAQKIYAEGPGFMFPGNIGIQGNVATACVGQRMNSGQPPLGVITEAAHAHMAGIYYSLGRNSVTLAPGQSFRAELAAGLEPQLTLSGFFGLLIDAATQLNHMNRLIYNYLDGWLGAEVQ